MRVAVLSGKGGAGKTLTAVNLAAAAGKAVYVDCDVEEPNGRLFLKPERVRRQEVYTGLPEFDAAKCKGCRACVDFCRFHALVYIKEKPRVFPEVCHNCGGCMLVCPQQAVSETKRRIGYVEEGSWKDVTVITGVLDPGEASGIPVIEAALKAGDKAAEIEAAKAGDKASGNAGGLVVLDCPPGSACSVAESLSGADYCILAAEPTAFGFHNFRMVYELVSLYHKPCGVIMNKLEEPFQPLERFCQDHGIPVLLRIPYSRKAAEALSRGEVLTETDDSYRDMFRQVLTEIGGGRL